MRRAPRCYAHREREVKHPARAGVLALVSSSLFQQHQFFPSKAQELRRVKDLVELAVRGSRWGFSTSTCRTARSRTVERHGTRVDPVCEHEQHVPKLGARRELDEHVERCFIQPCKSSMNSTNGCPESPSRK